MGTTSKKLREAYHTEIHAIISQYLKGKKHTAFKITKKHMNRKLARLVPRGKNANHIVFL